MGSHFSAPVKIRSERSTRGILALLLVIGVLAAITITGSGIAGASSLSGTFAPRVYEGKIDLDGDGAITAGDAATNFFGATGVVDGKLDCNAWLTTVNAKTAGNGSINGSDDCTLQAYDGSTDGLFLIVVDGVIDHLEQELGEDTYDVQDGWQMPAIYRHSSMTTSGISGADWAWSAIGGRIDWSRNGSISSGDCALGVLGDTDLCVTPSVSSAYGLIDLDDDDVVDLNDSCYDGCFWGYNVEEGFLQAERGLNGAPGSQGSPGPAGKDGVSGRVSIISSSSTNSLNKSKSATCSGTTKVLGGGYNLVGTTSTLAHLTVVANGPVSGGWRVRVIEATPTTGTWSVDVSAICATA